MNTSSFKSLLALLRKLPTSEESEYTIELMRLLSRIRSDRRMTLEELSAVCYWKSPRAIRLIESNDRENVLGLTKEAFNCEDEKIRVNHLTRLHGVSIPMASSVLTLVWPEHYGVIDVRVWQVLFRHGAVDTKPDGLGFNTSDWLLYLTMLRLIAEVTERTVRSIEKTLFEYHKSVQVGPLYKSQKCTERK